VLDAPRKETEKEQKKKKKNMVLGNIGDAIKQKRGTEAPTKAPHQTNNGNSIFWQHENNVSDNK
jgi:hypothetical protein